MPTKPDAVNSAPATANVVIKEPKTAQPFAILDLIDLKNMDALDVFKLISQKSGLNIVAAQNVQGRVTVYLKDIDVLDALKIIVEAYGWAYIKEKGIIKVVTAIDYETKVGHKFGQTMETRIKQLLYADGADLLAVLNQMKSVTGKVISDEKSHTLILMDDPKKLDEMEAIITRVDVPRKTEVFHLNYSTAEDISKKITETLTPGVGFVKVDDRSNRLVISDTPQKIEELRQIIEAFDQKDNQVLIEAKIVQIVLSDAYKMGVDWEGLVRKYHNLDFVSHFDEIGTTDKRGKLSIGTFATDDYNALIEALSTIGDTKILSSPRITAINNKEAKILVGSTVPYVTTTTTTPAAGAATTAEAVNFIEVGVKLFVTPTIHKDGFITMKIKPEVSSVTSNLTTSNNNKIPIVETSEAETTVVVKDGVTVVIGGLIKEETVNTTKKVPGLGDIPVLGGAFRNKDNKFTKTEIAIFLTPRIMTGDVNENMALNASSDGKTKK